MQTATSKSCAAPAWTLTIPLFPGIRPGVVACGLLSASIFLAGCGRTPDLGSAEAFLTADALYTALTSRRVNLLDDVAKQFDQLQTQGQLSDAASAELDAIMQMARAAEWQAAAEKLDMLIRNQPSRPHRHE